MKTIKSTKHGDQDLTATQKRLIEELKESGKHLNIRNIKIEDFASFVSVSFKLKSEHPLLEENYHIFIGRRGKIRWISASRLGAGRDHEITLARLASMELFRWKTFNFGE